MAMKLFKGRYVIFSGGEVHPATIIVSKEGKIIEIINEYIDGEDDRYEMVVDAGDSYLMPGVVDCHVHVNEPGRTEWEGYSTATQAAAAGGITTIIDMPLNSVPSTVSVDNFMIKLNSAYGKCHVDVGFWGGIIPGNQDELRPMLDKGVRGFKCFMINSGVDDFPHVQESDIRAAMEELQGTSAVILFHAEDETADPVLPANSESRKYNTFLLTRPDSWEVKAIDTVCRLCEEYGVRCHIVHLASSTPLPMLEKAKENGLKLTVETTHHYLSLDADSVPDGATQYKCCPPIRSKRNQTALWNAVKAGVIDMVVSDHSPCIADLKLIEEGDFLRAWGGIASVQFGLSLFWTGCKQRDLGLDYLTRALCEQPAKLCNLDKTKGQIAVGMDADFVIWNPNDTTKILKENICHKNKETPYLDRELQGRVQQTFVRGNLVYDQGKFADTPRGKFLLEPVN